RYTGSVSGLQTFAAAIVWRMHWYERYYILSLTSMTSAYDHAIADQVESRLNEVYFKFDENIQQYIVDYVRTATRTDYLAYMGIILADVNHKLAYGSYHPRIHAILSNVDVIG